MKILAITIFITFSLFGCSSSSFVQIMEVNSPNCKSIEHIPMYENDTIRVAYIFWAERGFMGVFIHNKLNQPLYIDWKKCSFIVGATKHDYWQDNVSITTSGVSSSSAKYSSNSSTSSSGSAYAEFSSDSQTEFWPDFFQPKIYSKTKTTGDVSANLESSSSTAFESHFFQTTFNKSLTRMMKQERITFIPPGTTICKTEFDLAQKEYYELGLKQIQELELITETESSRKYAPEYESKQVKIFYSSYSSDNSPLSFRSFITYSTDERFLSESYIDNYFYVSRISMVPENIFRYPDNKRILAAPNAFFLKVHFSNDRQERDARNWMPQNE